VIAFDILNTVKHRSWLLLVLLIFVGQILAEPLNSCQMDSSSGQSHDMNMMDHTMADMEMNDSMDMSCCGDKCDCPDGICVSFAMISSWDMNFQFAPMDSYSVVINPFQLNQPSFAIFHPPILS